MITFTASLFFWAGIGLSHWSVCPLSSRMTEASKAKESEVSKDRIRFFFFFLQWMVRKAERNEKDLRYKVERSFALASALATRVEITKDVAE